MEQDTQTVNDYKKLTKDLIRENTTAFAVGGALFLIALVAISLRYGTDMRQALSRQATELSRIFNTETPSNESVNEVVKSISDQSINYISPIPTKSASQDENLGVAGEENGQISAISSGQVTYKRNKYTIQPGESLQDVARKVYGDPNAWVRIAQANNIKDPDHIEVGMELTIPR